MLWPWPDGNALLRRGRGLSPRAGVNGETNMVVHMRKFEQWRHSHVVWPVGGTPQELCAVIRREIGQWREIVARAGVGAE